MKSQRLVLGLTALNLVILTVAVLQTRAAHDVDPIVRARVIELVDERGVVRSRLKTETDGEVVFRLFDGSGTVRVKLGASEGGSGLVLNDETTAPGVHLIARRTATAARRATTGIAVTGADGRQRLVATVGAEFPDAAGQ